MLKTQRMWAVLASAVLVSLCTGTWADSDPAKGENCIWLGRGTSRSNQRR